jgi:hypothetical protein
MGFDGSLFGRADHEDIQNRNRTKTLEMVWKASTNLGKLWKEIIVTSIFI